MAEEKEEETLVSIVDEHVKTDVLTELRTGIYNLIINYYHHLVVAYGPESAMQVLIQYLEEITYNFKSAIEEQ